ncbi:amidohydrolase family protein [Actinophytocola sp.]|uniref:amidohydrolase family protein n=1 Tax=Actinophytocola sp. TaxID=1872138 RepID=UPI0025BF5255|nr:amidohydrolase family protein [Actinophytocola sp.]
MPGLIDAHTHVFDGSLARALRHGVTTELDMFCLPANLARQRKPAADRDDIADLRSASILATPPGGHPTQLLAGDEATRESLGDAYGPFETISDPRDAAAFVDARLVDGADYLKVVIDDGAATGGDLPVLGPAVVAALVEAAHAANLKVIAHVADAGATTIALDAGVDGLAHVFSDADEPAAASLAARIAAQGVFVATTLVHLDGLLAANPVAPTVSPPRWSPPAPCARRACRCSRGRTRTRSPRSTGRACTASSSCWSWPA